MGARRENLERGIRHYVEAVEFVRQELYRTGCSAEILDELGYDGLRLEHTVALGLKIASGPPAGPHEQHAAYGPTTTTHEPAEYEPDATIQQTHTAAQELTHALEKLRELLGMGEPTRPMTPELRLALHTWAVADELTRYTQPQHERLHELGLILKQSYNDWNSTLEWPIDPSTGRPYDELDPA